MTVTGKPVSNVWINMWMDGRIAEALDFGSMSVKRQATLEAENTRGYG
jgi:hypothetical protein